MDYASTTTRDYDSFINVTSEFEITEMVFQQKHHRGFMFRVIGSVITSIIALISFVGNIAVICLYFLDELIRTQPGNVPIAYLALSDTLNSMFAMIPSVITIAADDWIFGDIACKTVASIYSGCFASSIVYIALISVDRCIAVLYPFKYQVKVTTGNLVIVCNILCVYSIIVGMILGLPHWSKYVYFEAICSLNFDNFEEIFYVVFIGGIIAHVIPTVIMIISNILIIKAANKSAENAQTLFIRRSNMYKRNDTGLHNRKTIKTMIVVIIAFQMCYLPFALTTELHNLIEFEVPLWLSFSNKIFFFVSSAINPFIYAIFRKDFRVGFKKLFKLIFIK